MPPIRFRILTIMILVGAFAVVLGVWRFLVDVTNPLYFWDVLFFGVPCSPFSCGNVTGPFRGNRTGLPERTE